MPRTIGDPVTLTEIMRQFSGEFIPILATLTHATLAVPFYVCNDVKPIISNGRLFLGWKFDVQFPSDSFNELPMAQATMNNSDPDGELAYILQNMADKDPPIVKLEFMRYSTPDTIICPWGDMKLRNVRVASQITGRLTCENILSEPLTAKIDPYNIPGAFGGPQQA